MTHDETVAATTVGEAPAPRPRARLIDVATAAGVSPKTVSRVINDEPGVLPQTRDRVRQTVRRWASCPTGAPGSSSDVRPTPSAS